MQIENLIPASRHNYDNMLLWGVVPGQYTNADPTKPMSRHAPKTLCCFYHKLVDELLTLHAGVEAHDHSVPVGHPGHEFQLRAMLLLIKADYPGVS
jgi:hypothetical protein